MFSLMGLLASIHAVIFYGLRTPRRVADKPVIANYRRVYRAPPRPIQRAFDVCIGRWTTVRELPSFSIHAVMQ